MPSYVENTGEASSLQLNNKLDYRSFGMFTRDQGALKQRKRDEKFDEKLQRASLLADDPLSGLNIKKSRGRKTKQTI